MAVKFSQFTLKTTAEASNVTEIVGYLSTGNENIRIVPSAFDTTYAFTTVTDGSNVDLIFTPNSEFSRDAVEVQVYNEIINNPDIMHIRLKNQKNRNFDIEFQ